MYLTELEIIETQEQNLFLLEKQLTSKKYGIDEIADFIPGFLHLNKIDDGSILYTNKATELYFGMTYKQMVYSGKKHMLENFHPSTFTDLIPKAVNFGKQNDFDKVLGIFQWTRRDKNQGFDAVMGFAKISKQLNCLVCIENPVSIFGEMAKKMNSVLDDNEFLRKNYRKFASLTKREIEIIKLIGSGECRNEIADMLFISKHTFDNHRKNIREKLELKSTAELFHYIHVFDLI